MSTKKQAKTKKAVKKAVERFSYKEKLENKLGKLAYQIGQRQKFLTDKLQEFQQELNNDEELKDLQEEANNLATKLEKLEEKDGKRDNL